MSSRYRAVFFDLGGTLFSYRSVGRWTADALIGCARRMGIDATPAEIGGAYRQAMRSVNERFARQAFYLHSELFREAWRELARGLGHRASEADLNGFEDALREALVGNLVLRDDCLETLRVLRERGLYLSIVSNIDDDHLHPMVERSGLAHVLDDWTSSEEARSCKPHPRFFEVALEKARRRPREVLFVGDSPEHDVAGAKGVGMTAALIVEDGSGPPLQTGKETAEPDHRIRTLSELLEIV